MKTELIQATISDHADFAIINLGTSRSAKIVLIEEEPSDAGEVRLPLLKLPGGRMEKGELPSFTLRREIGEELGITVEARSIFFRWQLGNSSPHMFNAWTVTTQPGVKIEHLSIGDGIRQIVVVGEGLLAEMLAAGECIAPIHAAALKKYLFMSAAQREQ